MNDPRHPAVISGAIRSHVEQLQHRMKEPSFSLTRINQLLDELDQSINIQQFQNSVALTAATRVSDAGKGLES